jgi:tRNA-2-methylthio-N6-dimethylallyladenosine synthase
MTASVIEAMATCDKVCPQLHLPVQSGSSPLLERMERGYSADEYLSLVERVRAAIPALALTTDIIVGFPGETESDFEATLNLMRGVRYDSAFMFKYSRRDHTKAAKWDETVSETEKATRLQAVIATQDAISAEIYATMIGQTTQVLVEGAARRRDGWLVGKTPQFKTTVFPDCGAAPGDLVDVRIEHTTAHTLVGTPMAQQWRPAIRM